MTFSLIPTERLGERYLVSERLGTLVISYLQQQQQQQQPLFMCQI